MVDLTDRLALRKPTGSDPFLRSDFEYNWERVDDYPGSFPCTSTTRPSWGTDQAGLFIHETDTGKFVRWTGSAWVTPNVFPKAQVFSTFPNVTISPSGSYTQAMGSFTAPRACNVLIIGSAHFQTASGTAYQYAITGITVDASPVSITDGVVGGVVFGGDHTAPLLGWATSVTAGSHALAGVTTIGGGATSISLRNISMTVLYIDN